MIIEVLKVKFRKPVRVKPIPRESAAFYKMFGLDPKSIIDSLLNKHLNKLDSNEELVEGDTFWGKMEIKRVRMTKTERHHSFRHRYSYVGPFRYPHRALLPISDGRAWHHRVSGKGGTVLIDCSSSMSISTEDILEVLKTNPLATISIYHGDETNQGGYLKILAANNKYAVDFDIEGGGNVVDGPALRWLAKQERPRIWVCDGGVTGVNDINATPAMCVEVARTIKRADVRWVERISDIPKALKGNYRRVV